MKTFINVFDTQFAGIHHRSRELVSLLPQEKLFRKPRELEKTFTMFSVGEYLLRSAGTVEQTFGGLTTRLWDDPFEWTLPEALSRIEDFLYYLEEVETTRKKGFSLLKIDEDLHRELPAPEELKTILALLLETVARAEHFQGRAFAVFQMFSDTKLPRLDI